MAALGAYWAFALFGSAGDWEWTRGWICYALYGGGTLVMTLIVRRKQPGLMEERAKMRRPDTKPFDKLFFAIFLPLMLLLPVVAGCDYRYQGPTMPDWLLWPGAAISVAGTALVTWTLSVNRHAESTVRIQTDRGHTVVTGGPYRYVRPPMYVGIILSYLAAPLILGSWWSFAVSGSIAMALIWRTVNEDATLQRELPGHRDFARRTPYRLLPGLW